MVFHSACIFFSSDADASHAVDSARASAFAQSSSFFARFWAHSSFFLPRSSCRDLKKASQAVRKRVQIACDFLRETGPTAFHSAWSFLSASAVFTQSVDADSASACSHSAVFFLRFSA